MGVIILAAVLAAGCATTTESLRVAAQVGARYVGLCVDDDPAVAPSLCVPCRSLTVAPAMTFDLTPRVGVSLDAIESGGVFVGGCGRLAELRCDEQGCSPLRAWTCDEE